ncbi:hypothetical protein NIES4074_47220 [Cylindrospermum sp. NIES-4074]|jgi:hypothetical protein|nr:hypothetical protein NIES4074_47220 [Cylindrospermum sp. NIES-4074]
MPTPSENTNDPKAVAKLAGKVIGDRQLLSKLSDRVYELILEDLRHQKERGKN